ncbi:MAG: peptidoglycan editing factor PgeF [Myxococcota bacterium]
MSIPLLRLPILQECPNVAHGFTTREGGVSRGPRASLHLAVRDGDVHADIVENWRRATEAIGCEPAQLVLLDQVHGCEVVRVNTATGPLATAAAADGVVSCTPGLVLAVRTADCVPVLFAAPGGVAVAHAGWRGVVAGVVPQTVRALCEATGAAPSDVVAAVGPHAQVAAYEVGPAVVDALVGAGLRRERVSRMGAKGREHADLGQAVLDQLSALGVTQVQSAGACTMHEARFFSHRRDGSSTGRLAGLITLRAP